MGEEEILTDTNGEDGSTVVEINDIVVKSQESDSNNKTEDENGTINEEGKSTSMDLGNDTTKEITGLNSFGMATKNNPCKKGNVNMVTCKETKEVTGHTGYLTFATLLPSFCTS